MGLLLRFLLGHAVCLRWLQRLRFGCLLHPDPLGEELWTRRQLPTCRQRRHDVPLLKQIRLHLSSDSNVRQSAMHLNVSLEGALQGGSGAALLRDPERRRRRMPPSMLAAALP